MTETCYVKQKCTLPKASETGLPNSPNAPSPSLILLLGGFQLFLPRGLGGGGLGEPACPSLPAAKLAADAFGRFQIQICAVTARNFSQIIMMPRMLPLSKMDFYSVPLPKICKMCVIFSTIFMLTSFSLPF